MQLKKTIKVLNFKKGRFTERKECCGIITSHLNPGVLQKLVTKVTHLKEMKSDSLANVMIRFESDLGTGNRCFKMLAVLCPSCWNPPHTQKPKPLLTPNLVTQMSINDLHALHLANHIIWTAV